MRPDFQFFIQIFTFLVPGYPQAQTSAPVQPTQAPPQPPLGKPTKAQSTNQCKNKDNDANCTYYAYLGFCKKASYASYMAQNCKKSCNLC